MRLFPKFITKILKKQSFLVLSMLFFASFGMAQTAKIAGDAQFKIGNWSAAAAKYEAHLAKTEDTDAQFKLGKCYAALGQNDRAEAAFSKVVFDPESDPAAKMELGKILRAKGNYPKAITWFLKYAEVGPDSLIAYDWARACKNAMRLRLDSLGYKVNRIKGLNTVASDISPALYKNGIAFASSRKRGFFFQFVNKKNKKGFYDMYFSARSPDGQMAKPTRIQGKLNTRYNDGPAIFSKSDNQVWITRSNLGGLKRPKDANGLNKVNIYHAENQLGKWVNGKAVPISTVNFNIAHPAITNDGKTLVFSSDKPGGFGGFDLYISHLEGGKWSRPENLGKTVNTEYNEGYPYFSSEHNFWFASDRIDGFGGKDIYHGIWENGNCTSVWNAGYPLNSAADDFGICFMENAATGYFSTNRAGGEGDDDIMQFRRFKAVYATIEDAKTGLPIENARVEVMDINQKVHYYKTDEKGRFKHAIRVGKDIFLKIFKDDYHDFSQSVPIRGLGDDEDLHTTIKMEPIRRFLVTTKVKSNRKPIGNATVRIIGERESRGFTNAEGLYEQELEPQTAYRIVVFKEGFVPEIRNITTGEEGKTQVFDLDINLHKGQFRYLEGRTMDSEREVILGNVKVRVLNEGGTHEKENFVLGADGMFYKVLPGNQSYTVIASKEKYLPTRIDFTDSLKASDTLLKDIEMVPLMPDMVFRTVYFPYRSSSPNKEGMRKIQDVIVLLQDNPRIGIQLSAHTDSRGGASYNKKLSQERADALGKFIASKGIDPKRIITIGHGEEQLFNNCEDGRDCSDELHAQNRRAEIKIVRLEADGSMPK